MIFLFTQLGAQIKCSMRLPPSQPGGQHKTTPLWNERSPSVLLDIASHFKENILLHQSDDLWNVFPVAIF